MQQIHNLQPPGRFLIEDKTGDHRISSNNGSQSGDNAVHPLLLKKAWVQVENDKAMVKIMHRLREKDDKEPNTASSASGKKDAVNSDTSGEVETNAIKLEQPGEDFLQQNFSTTSGENESVGQYDDLFDDTDVVGQLGLIELSHAVHEHTEKGENDEGQYDDLVFGDSEDKSVEGGLFDRFFDNTGSHQLTLGDNVEGQFDGLFNVRGKNVEGGLHDGLIDADDANAPHTTLSHDHDVLFGRGADYAALTAQGNTVPLQVQQHYYGGQSAQTTNQGVNMATNYTCFASPTQSGSGTATNHAALAAQGNTVPLQVQQHYYGGQSAQTTNQGVNMATNYTCFASPTQSGSGTIGTDYAYGSPGSLQVQQQAVSSTTIQAINTVSMGPVSKNSASMATIPNKNVSEISPYVCVCFLSRCLTNVLRFLCMHCNLLSYIITYRTYFLVKGASSLYIQGINTTDH